MHGFPRQDWECARDEEIARGPFVTAAFAASADGCLSGERGRPTSISSRASLVLTHELRSLHDAVLVGVGTLLADDPLLTTRLVRGPSPRRVVLDSQLRTPLSARVLTDGGAGPILIAACDAPARRAAELEERGATVVRVPRSRRGVRVSAALDALAGLGLRAVMVEGGATILDAFFAEGAVDYVVQTIAPVMLAGPKALRLGDLTSTSLSRWAAQTFTCGPDTIALGRWAPSAIE